MRMLAELAVRAGYQVTALDYFGDVDLQALCPSRSLRRDTHHPYTADALAQAGFDLTAPSLVYGASLENHPEVVARLSQGRNLLGNSPDVLAAVRDPLRLALVLQDQGFACPQTVAVAQLPLPASGRSWLWKPLKSGGGHGIRPWLGGALPAEGILQERVAGPVCSAAFVGNGRQAVLLGLTEQLIGRRVFGATGFRYCGNLLPPRLEPAQVKRLLVELQALVNYLTDVFNLRGLNGLDFVWHRDRVWTLEVNPRPSASLELIDRAYDLRVFEAHVRSCNGQLPAFDLTQALTQKTAAGKAILFATHDVTVGDSSDWLAQDLRDIPHNGEQIGARQPVCTILAQGATPTDCWRRLQTKAKQIKQELERTP
jgi:hypothetical protein